MTKPRPRRGIKHPKGRAMAEKKTKLETQRERWDRAVVSVWSQGRRDADLSQEALASRLGWTRNMVAAVERGRRRVSVAELILFATAVNLDPERVFSRILRY